MNREQIINSLNETLLQFEMSVTEAEMGDADALEAEKSNRESVEALKHAIKLEETYMRDGRWEIDMERDYIIGRLTELLSLYTSELIDAEKGISDAIDNEDDSRKYIKALEDAIELEKRELLSEWIKLSDDFPKSRGDYWVTLKHRDGSLSVEKFKFDWDELVIAAWKETVIAWQPYYCPEIYKEN